MGYQSEKIRERRSQSILQEIGRVMLGSFLLVAGIGHLTWARQEFQAQVPNWLPLEADWVVVLSGIAEILLGTALVVVRSQPTRVGWVTVLFFVAVFPGNVSQFVNGTDAFGLTTDLARGIRLLFQPLLVVWALWATGAWAKKS